MEADAGITKIVFIGAGNVASSLAPALDALSGFKVGQVYSRTLESASTLASALASATAVDSTDDIDSDGDIYIISVSDDAIAPLVSRLRLKNPQALWLHTSGSVGCSVLTPLGSRSGVLYPLQTFSRRCVLDLADTPFFIESSDEAGGEVEKSIESLARRLSTRVYRSDSSRRRALHIAAVFACNFVNHMWAIADGILIQEGMTFDIFKPLLYETLRKALSVSPASGQTGPARRGDNAVMESHIILLPDDLADIYRLLSEHISRMYNNKPINES